MSYYQNLEIPTPYSLLGLCSHPYEGGNHSYQPIEERVGQDPLRGSQDHPSHLGAWEGGRHCIMCSIDGETLAQ